MAKKIITQIKLQVEAGKANPSPPIGPALGQHGVNIGQFVQQFNASTGHLNGMPVTVVISVYADKSFTYEVKSPPASVLLKEAAQIAKGSGLVGKESAGTVTREQVRAIAEKKMPDLNAYTIEGAERVVAGTARSMGLEVVD